MQVRRQQPHHGESDDGSAPRHRSCHDCSGCTDVNDPSPIIDSRQLADRAGLRHHNILKAIDLVLKQCPAAAAHFRFNQHPVTAGLGGTRYVRHASIDREGFMLLAMGFPTSQRELALTIACEIAIPPVGAIEPTDAKPSGEAVRS
ncbi:Rha family transcriptional regulator [Sphingomonas sp. IW22]|uniref:Rha family transcriptional regulator n=1 Tax=Sphingomonas sp. IW22 TaxID=3242489 RepID=UPI00351FDB9B